MERISNHNEMKIDRYHKLKRSTYQYCFQNLSHWMAIYIRRRNKQNPQNNTTLLHIKVSNRPSPITIVKEKIQFFNKNTRKCTTRVKRPTQIIEMFFYRMLWRFCRAVKREAAVKYQIVKVNTQVTFPGPGS